jgi:tRNA modification GTPase
MKYDYYDIEEPIAAMATPWGESALAVVRVSGRGAVERASVCFSRPRKITEAAAHSIVYGHIVSPGTGEKIDEVTAAVYRAPHGYTGQDAVEIFCHGSIAGVQKILEALRLAGFRDARPGEFTMRAFISGKMDLTQAEAVQEIVAAKSRRAHSLALHRLSGGLSAQLLTAKQELLDIMSRIEVQLDYAEDEVELEADLPLDEIVKIRKDLSRLASTYQTGRMYAEGVKIALAGPTNAGKSSLFNLFLKEDRSIVSEIHGTTRDYIESWVSLRGIPVRLYDTAGFRSSGNSIEEEGIRRSSQLVEQADLVLYLNGSDSDEIVTQPKPGYVYLWNKADVRKGSVPDGYLPLSAVTGEGFLDLEQRMIQLLQQRAGVPDGQDVLIDSLRQKELVERASGGLNAAFIAAEEGMPLDILASELQDAMDALGELTGEITSSDILDRIFSGFCVGK